MNIWEAYVEYAGPIFILHVVLSLTCLGCFAAGLFLLARERKAHGRIRGNGFDGGEDGSELSSLAALSWDMARKGEVLGPDLIRGRILQSLARYDVAVRYCLNAFVVSGLLGTLYNLWKLGPPFWAGLVSGQTESAQPAIGIAFSASVFGLGAALLFSFIDSFLIRLPREELARRAAGDIFRRAADALPPTEGAAVAEALQNFYSASEGFLTKLKEDHRELSQQFVRQIRDSSDQLTKTVATVSDQWVALVGGATASVEQLGGRLGAQVAGLTEATSGAARAVGEALPILRETEDLGLTLTQIRAQASQLQLDISARLDEFSRQWQSDLAGITRAHVEQMERTYSTGWQGYEERSEHWNRQITETVNRFAADIESSLAKWGEERQRVAEQVDALISSWRQELGRSTTGVSSGLAALNEQVESLKGSSSRLAASSDVVIQHLGDLERSVSSFSVKAVNGTPLGEAIDRLTTVVAAFGDDGRGPGDSLQPAPNSDAELLRAILEQLKDLPEAISRSVRRAQSENPAISRGAFEAGTPETPSLWGRIIGVFKR